MANIYIFVRDEAAPKIENMIPEAKVNENCFMELKNDTYGCYFDTRIGLTIYNINNMETLWVIPNTWIKTIFSL